MKPVTGFYPSKNDGYQSYCIDCARVYNKLAERRDRLQLLYAYGAKCKCCAEQELSFLALDHIDNDGAIHRKEIGGGPAITRHLRRLNWPTAKFQLLCHNCNAAKHTLGECPHETKRRLALALLSNKTPVTEQLSLFDRPSEPKQMLLFE